jgi:SulP family sulfate permease
MNRRALFPSLEWTSGIKQHFKVDAMAGLTGMVIVLPQAVAFAMIAGLPPEYGLYAAIVPTIIAALFGSSHHLVSGPTTAISLVMYAKLSQFAAPGSAEYIALALTLTFLVGVIQLTLGVFKLGALINFVSHSVMVGFTAGAGVLIMFSQMKHCLGVRASSANLSHLLPDLVRELRNTNFTSAGIALFVFVTAWLLRRFKPKWPGMLLALLLGSGLAIAINAKGRGVLMLGALKATLPPLSAPEISFDSVYSLTPSALVVAMLALAEAVVIARAIAIQSRQHVDSNQEFIGQGLSNIFGAFFSGYASSGSFTRSGVNYEAGAKTPMAAVYSALLLLGAAQLVAPLTAHLPMPAMGGALVFVAIHLIDVRAMRRIMTTSKPEGLVMGFTFFGALFFALEFAVIAGVMASLLLYLNRTSHPRIDTLTPDPADPHHGFVPIAGTQLKECPQLKVLRIDGSIFFGAVNHIANEIDKISAQFPETKHILIEGGGVNFIDVSGCEMLYELRAKMLDKGVILHFCSLKPEVLNVVNRGGCLRAKAPYQVFTTKYDAIHTLVPLLDAQRCRPCDLRTFAECAQLPRPEGE